MLFQLCCLCFVLFSCSDDDDVVREIEIPTIESAVIDIESGGSTEPNQVYIDLSTEDTTIVRRDTWELGFVSSENRVILNNSILVSAARLDGFTDIDAVTEATTLQSEMNLKSLNPNNFSTIDVSVSTVEELIAGLPVGYEMYGNLENDIAFTDSPDGDLNKTAFGTIATTEAEAEVYVVSLGKEIPEEPAVRESINTAGETRGFYKVKVFMQDGNYVLQYAPLDETSHTELQIAKDETYDFVAFSLANGEQVDVVPAKNEWDLNYTSVFSYYGSMGNIAAGITYSDYVLHNTTNGVGVYTVLTEEPGEGEDATPQPTESPSYDDFTLADVEEAELNFTDRTLIGSNWRIAGQAETRLKTDRYYVIKDAEGNFYKLQFTALMNESGERGYPQIRYDLLQ